MSNNTDIANVFIIPNRFEQLNVANAKEEWRADNDRFAITSQNSSIDRLGIDPSFKLVDGDGLVQLWFCGLGSDNWCDHGLPKELRSEDTPNVRIPSLWPVRCFKDLKEGDKFTLSINGHDVEITACQLQFRYRGFGTFEETIQHISRRAS